MPATLLIPLLLELHTEPSSRVEPYAVHELENIQSSQRGGVHEFPAEDITQCMTRIDEYVVFQPVLAAACIHLA
jgi:hypothetical protein